MTFDRKLHVYGAGHEILSNGRNRLNLNCKFSNVQSRRQGSVTTDPVSIYTVLNPHVVREKYENENFSLVNWSMEERDENYSSTFCKSHCLE